MQIYIKALTNIFNGRTLALEVEPSDTVINLKAKIEETEKIPSANQRLVFAGQQLEDQETLANYNIQRASTLQIVIK